MEGMDAGPLVSAGGAGRICFRTTDSAAEVGSSSDILETFILVFGWVFAIFTAAGLFCSDLEDRLQAFWQSRPMPLWKWTLAKYCTGLICVLAVCLIPVIVMIMVLRIFWPPQWETETDWALLSYLSYTIIVIYSLSVLISCLAGQADHPRGDLVRGGRPAGLLSPLAAAASGTGQRTEYAHTGSSPPAGTCFRYR